MDTEAQLKKLLDDYRQEMTDIRKEQEQLFSDTIHELEQKRIAVLEKKIWDTQNHD